MLFFYEIDVTTTIWPSGSPAPVQSDATRAHVSVGTAVFPGDGIQVANCPLRFREAHPLNFSRLWSLELLNHTLCMDSSIPPSRFRTINVARRSCTSTKRNVSVRTGAYISECPSICSKCLTMRGHHRSIWQSRVEGGSATGQSLTDFESGLCPVPQSGDTVATSPETVTPRYRGRTNSQIWIRPIPTLTMYFIAFVVSFVQESEMRPITPGSTD
jgi:hypothetical protein